MKLPARNETRTERIIDGIHALHDARGFRVWAKSTTAATHTGDTDETVLATIRLPGKLIGKNGVLRLSLFCSRTGATASAVVRVRLGGAAGSALFAGTLPTTAKAGNGIITVWNCGAENSQKVFNNGFATQTQGTNGVLTAAVDTSEEQSLVIAGDLGNAADSVSLEAYVVEVYSSG